MTGTRPPSRASGPSDRAQSVFDYSIGISIFLVVIIGSLVFLPSGFASFDSDNGNDASEQVTASTAANALVESVLASSDNSNQLDFGCTLLFFNQRTTHPDIQVEPDDCGFSPGAPVAVNASVDPTATINVTLEADLAASPGREPLIWDPDDSNGNGLRIDERANFDPTSDDITLAVGSNADDNDDYEVAVRSGRLAGTNVYIVVRAW